MILSETWTSPRRKAWLHSNKPGCVKKLALYTFFWSSEFAMRLLEKLALCIPSLYFPLSLSPHSTSKDGGRECEPAPPQEPGNRFVSFVRYVRFHDKYSTVCTVCAVCTVCNVMYYRKVSLRHHHSGTESNDVQNANVVGKTNKRTNTFMGVVFLSSCKKCMTQHGVKCCFCVGPVHSASKAMLYSYVHGCAANSCFLVGDAAPVEVPFSMRFHDC